MSQDFRTPTMQQLKGCNKQYILVLFMIYFILASFPCVNFAQSQSSPQAEKTIIEVSDTQFQVDGKGKAVKAFDIRFIHPDGSISKEGYFGTKGEQFNVIVVNKTAEPITIHWHGLIVPNNQDGVPDVTQIPIKPGKSYPYQYKLVQSGTYWMHSHVGFQEQQQLAAPFIIYESGKTSKNQEIIMFLEDFTYHDPAKIFEKLRKTSMPAMENMDMQSSMKIPHNMSMKSDYNDVDYDAFLTNKVTLANPQIKTVTAGTQVRLRIINGSASTNYEINLGSLTGTLVAVDGENIKPIHGNKFPIGIGNRLDIIISIPEKGGAFPILAQVEGSNKQTGLLLATAHAVIPKLNLTASQNLGRIPYYELEKQLSSPNPLPTKKADVSLNYTLQGTMNGYKWTLNGESWPKVIPKVIKKGQRVEMVFTNKNKMSHPMHFHGHVFQVTEIDGVKLKNGALRDTILVQPNSTVKVEFDANNPGIWLNHCHNLYHFAGGMGTTVEFAGYPKPSFYLQAIGETQPAKENNPQ
ncbi:multicopper oxidase family protein [Legionella cardiaca]|uniref:Multicopper oxidase family protein n=1 Tax=Legionella cardiaca TaxID=1071983 RepID=A0ABY8ARI9_9GAMM|nr:multicopper oxidase family protein [Legionella cardiaca]WED43292.1 multicopper oxidase family protein [Legionella cardiaca]